ncbi:putative exostosin [Helianthus annuus]|nr:putative exostosin [Helianthus annuus]
MKPSKFINLMISLSDTPHKPPKPDSLDRKNSLKHYLPRTWIIICVFFLQIFLLLLARNLHTSSVVFNHPEPPAISAVNPTIHGGDSECPYGKIYVYELPAYFNTELLENCHELNPWGSRCDTYSNDGLGRPAKQLAGVVPESLTGAWFWTDQFASEIIYHNRMLNYRCRTMDGEAATAYYIPLYAGLAVGKYLWTDNYTAEDRDRHCEMMLKWVHDQPYWNKSDGWDHFVTMGRITWDFRRSKKEDWGSGCIYLPGMRNITRLLIERNSWDYFDVGVPYPTGFHPSSVSDVATWQEFVRTRTRDTLFCFAGATRGLIKNDFRGLLLNQCYNASGSCRVVDCGGSKCSNGTSVILESFLGSDFCLQPRGDSFTRRSIFDCMIAGSIPVFFWNRTAYSQYEWFLPGQPESYSVFIDKKEVLNGISIKGVLEKFGKDEVRKMREKVIEYIPRIVYAKPHEGIEGMKDAFDVAIEGVLNRIKDQEQEGFKW